MEKTLVRNASDKRQVTDAKRMEKDREEFQLNDMRAVLSTKEGRRMLWRFMEHCRVFETIWSPNSLIHKNAGRQDVGHYIMSEIVRADEDALFKMMKDNKQSFIQGGSNV